MSTVVILPSDLLPRLFMGRTLTATFTLVSDIFPGSEGESSPQKRTQVWSLPSQDPSPQSRGSRSQRHSRSRPGSARSAAQTRVIPAWGGGEEKSGEAAQSLRSSRRRRVSQRRRGSRFLLQPRLRDKLRRRLCCCRRLLSPATAIFQLPRRRRRPAAPALVPLHCGDSRAGREEQRGPMSEIPERLRP